MSENTKLDQLNARLFGLEGRMHTLETVSRMEGETRKALLEAILANQERQETRLRAVEIRIALAGGGIALLQVVIQFGPKVFQLLH